MLCSVSGYHEFFFTLNLIKSRGGQPIHNFLYCVPKVSTIFFFGEQWVNQMFHDDTPVLSAAIEFVKQTFDRRPPKFYFRT